MSIRPSGRSRMTRFVLALGSDGAIWAPNTPIARRPKSPSMPIINAGFVASRRASVRPITRAPSPLVPSRAHGHARLRELRRECEQNAPGREDERYRERERELPIPEGLDEYQRRTAPDVHELHDHE